MNDRNVTVIWGGGLLLSWRDTTSPYLSGKVGVRQCLSRSVRWDNFLAWDASASPTVAAYDDYYPFGQQMDNRSFNSGFADGRYKYTEKERDAESGYDYFGARYYDARVGRFLSRDRFADNYRSLSPYSYGADNPCFYRDSNGDSLITINITQGQGFIHGINSLTIDHSYQNDVTNILQSAVDNGVHVHINGSFRSLEEQESPEIQDRGTTPAGDQSRHVAGFAVDFTLYHNNVPSEGLNLQNVGESAENNRFIRSIGENQSRWGGDFNRPDPIHLDAGTNTQLTARYGVNFSSRRDENQTQFSTRGVSRSIDVRLQFPIRRLEPAGINFVTRP